MAICVTLAIMHSTGCGTSLTNLDTVALVSTDCDSSFNKTEREAGTVILDWQGGTSPLYPGEPFDPVDLSHFKTTDGGSLADVEAQFRQAVRDEVARILCELPEFAMRVETGKASEAAANVVQFAAMKSPRADGQVGEGEYDPCNQYDNNHALVFGDELRMLGQQFSFDDWVMIFANVAAHETAHLLGYGHAPRPAEPQSVRSLYVELMYATHTVQEMLQQQRLLADIEYCPHGAAQARLGLDEPDTWTAEAPE